MVGFLLEEINLPATYEFIKRRADSSLVRFPFLSATTSSCLRGLFGGSLPAVHLFQFADAGALDGCGGWGVVEGQRGGAAASGPRLLGGNRPHGPGLLLLLRLVCLLFRCSRGHGLETETAEGTGLVLQV